MWQVKTYLVTTKFKPAKRYNPYCGRRLYEFDRFVVSGIRRQKMAQVGLLAEDSNDDDCSLRVTRKVRRRQRSSRQLVESDIESDSGFRRTSLPAELPLGPAPGITGTSAHSKEVISLLTDSDDEANSRNVLRPVNTSQPEPSGRAASKPAKPLQNVEQTTLPSTSSRSSSSCSEDLIPQSSSTPRPSPAVAVAQSLQLRTPSHASKPWWQKEQAPTGLSLRTLQILSTPGAPPSRRMRTGAATSQQTGRAFAKVRVTMAKQLYDEWNTLVFSGRLPADLPLRWNARLVASAGQCVDDGSLNKTKTHPNQKLPTRIDLSAKLITAPSRLRDVLAHEMCHAAAWLIDCEYSRHHGVAFWQWANTFMRLVEDITITRYHDYQTNEQFHWRCIKCSHTYSRHRQTIDPRVHVCKVCGGGLEFLGHLTQPGASGAQADAIGGVKVEPKPPRGFSAFVQQHFAEARKAMPPGTSHGHVMKKLSCWWHEAKQQLMLPGASPTPSVASPQRLALLPLSALHERNVLDPVGKRSSSPMVLLPTLKSPSTVVVPPLKSSPAALVPSLKSAENLLNHSGSLVAGSPPPDPCDNDPSLASTTRPTSSDHPVNLPQQSAPALEPGLLPSTSAVNHPAGEAGHRLLCSTSKTRAPAWAVPVLGSPHAGPSMLQAQPGSVDSALNSPPPRSSIPASSPDPHSTYPDSKPSSPGSRYCSPESKSNPSLHSARVSIINLQDDSSSSSSSSSGSTPSLTTSDTAAGKRSRKSKKQAVAVIMRDPVASNPQTHITTQSLHTPTRRKPRSKKSSQVQHAAPGTGMDKPASMTAKEVIDTTRTVGKTTICGGITTIAGTMTITGAAEVSKLAPPAVTQAGQHPVTEHQPGGTTWRPTATGVFMHSSDLRCRSLLHDGFGLDGASVSSKDKGVGFSEASPCRDGSVCSNRFHSPGHAGLLCHSASNDTAHPLRRLYGHPGDGLLGSAGTHAVDEPRQGLAGSYAGASSAAARGACLQDVTAHVVNVNSAAKLGSCSM